MEGNFKLYLIDYAGPIPELNFINGPILTPSKLNIQTVGLLVKNGKRLYEVNPLNKEDRVLLTVDNFDKDNFGLNEDGEESDEGKTEEPVKEEEKKAEPKKHSKKRK